MSKRTLSVCAMAQEIRSYLKTTATTGLWFVQCQHLAAVKNKHFHWQCSVHATLQQRIFHAAPRFAERTDVQLRRTVQRREHTCAMSDHHFASYFGICETIKYSCTRGASKAHRNRWNRPRIRHCPRHHSSKSRIWVRDLGNRGNCDSCIDQNI